jgi:hypothetical protein
MALFNDLKIRAENRQNDMLRAAEQSRLARIAQSGRKPIQWFSWRPLAFLQRLQITKPQSQPKKSRQAASQNAW